MSQATPPPPGLAAPLTLLAVLGGGAAGVLAVSVAADAAAAGGFTPPTPGGETLRALLEGGGGDLDPLIGAGGSRLVFWSVLAAIVVPLAVLATVAGTTIAARAARRRTPAGAMASRRQLGTLAGPAAASRARQLRPALGARRPDRDEIGLRVGRVGRRDDVFASYEDVVLMICGPRSNKTSAIVVPAALSAPGPVIVTSNKVDAYTLTAHARAAVGHVFTFDPQDIARVPQTFWWNPLRSVVDMATAAQLAEHFIATVGGGSDREDVYFTPASARLLSQHILAAAVSTTGHSLRDVRSWLATRSFDPANLLSAAGLNEVATSLLATMEAPPEQRGGLYETALTAMGALDVEAVARYVTPPSTWLGKLPPTINRVVEFDPWQFFAEGYLPDSDGKSRDTLYLLTREGAGTAAPVVAALVDRLLKTASDVASARGGRVEPPPRVVLDEAANICPIKNLPDFYSYFGSQSIQTITILQSYQQGVAVWGRSGMDKLWSASTVKLVGAGVHDASFCEDVSRLVGEHDVPHDTVQSGRGGGGTSYSRSTRRERILAAADVAALPNTTAVLFAAGRPPALLTLLPWYTEPERAELQRHADEAMDQVRQAAAAALGTDNPVGRMLAAELRTSGAAPGQEDRR